MSEESKTKRTRSPAYPAIDLEEALDKAATLWQKINRHAAPVETIGGMWGFESNSSAAVSAASAMLKYGLIIDEGESANRQVKLTDDGIRLTYNPDKESKEYQQLLKKAALSPKIHAELWKKYSGLIPDDSLVKRYLVVDRRFNEQYVDGFIKQFRKTIKFSNLISSDKVYLVENENDGSETMIAPLPKKDSDLQPKPPSNEKGVVDLAALPKQPSEPRYPVPPPGESTREFKFPLPTGTATVMVPFPMTERDFSSLIATLETFKDGLVKKQIPTLDTCDVNYEKQLAALADAEIDFDVANFRFSFDFEPLKAISQTHNLRLTFNLDTGTAFLRKKSVPPRPLPAKAIWKNKDFDKPVTIVNEAGRHNGVLYYQSEDGTGIPANELTFQH